MAGDRCLVRRLLGEPAFVASATEVVWEFAERRCLAIEE